MTLLFVGRATLDLGYVCERFPAEDEKLSAERFTMAGGGPSLNAAIAARALGSQIRLVSAVGSGVLADFVRGELAAYGVELCDLALPGEAGLPVSSIIVVPGNGTRTVIDRRPAFALAAVDPDEVLSGVTLVLSDGHLADAAIAVLRRACERGIPTVLDGGSWKPSSAAIIPLIDYAILSERFRPGGEPGDEQLDEPARDPLAAVHELGPAHVAVTRGGGAIAWSARGKTGTIHPPQVEAVDTLGAGDIFHGAFCHSLAGGADFPAALEQASEIASLSCRFFGTREWIGALPGERA